MPANGHVERRDADIALTKICPKETKAGGCLLKFYRPQTPVLGNTTG